MTKRHEYGSKFYDLTLKKILKTELLSFFEECYLKKM
jgi:hypothetical protein